MQIKGSNFETARISEQNDLINGTINGFRNPAYAGFATGSPDSFADFKKIGELWYLHIKLSSV
ncbi:MAG: hypothetical protein QME16_05410 [Planctomycetota bacterium]|nr:hypothetical protein [Planctomycetota bacterium]